MTEGRTPQRRLGALRQDGFTGKAAAARQKSSWRLPQDVATDSMALGPRVRKATRSRASGSPLPGEGMESPNSLAGRRILPRERGISRRKIEICADGAQNRT
jgi:hypothetical protein